MDEPRNKKWSQIGVTILCKSDHSVKYFCTSRSVKRPFPIHEKINYTKQLRQIHYTGFTI